MKRILIDEKIRDYASEYKSKFEEENKSVKTDLKYIKEFLCKNNELVKQEENTIVKLFDELINDYPTILTLEPSQWEIYKKKYDGIIEKTDVLKKKYFYESKKEKKKELHKILIDCLKYKESRKCLAEIHQKMNIRTCVYCNTQYAECDEKDIFYEYEHINAKSLYPFLGICFYNLIPVDGACNKHKSNTPSVIEIFTNNNNDLNPLNFIISIKDFMNPLNVECIDIKLVGSSNEETEFSKLYEKTFHINSKYASHCEDVEDTIKSYWKRVKSPYMHIDTGVFNPTFFDDYVESEDDIFDKPLRKLKHDIVKQYFK